MENHPKKASLPTEIDRIFSAGCADCELSKQSRPVRLRGSWAARVMAIGEAPGKEEEHEDCSFIGPAGKLLASTMRELGFPLDENVLMNNTVLCRPHPIEQNTRKENRSPTPDEIIGCRHNLEKIVSAHNPELIVLVGGVAAKAIMCDYPGSVSRTVGRFFGPTSHNLPCNADLYAIWHPAYILRNMSELPAFTAQLTRLRDYMLGRGIVIGRS